MLEVNSTAMNIIYPSMSLLTVTANTTSEHYTLNCHLLHVSAVVCRHQVDFTTKYIEKNIEARVVFTATINTDSD